MKIELEIGKRYITKCGEPVLIQKAKHDDILNIPGFQGLTDSGIAVNYHEDLGAYENGPMLNIIRAEV